MEKTINIATKVLVVALFTMYSYSHPAYAQTVQADVPIPYKSLTPQVESTIENTAIIALRHISQARSDIHQRALAAARRELAEAVRLMDSIRDNLSTSPAKNFIEVARKHLEYEQARQVLHDLPPIYASLEKVSVYLPTDRAKTHLDRAKAHLEKNDKRAADRELVLTGKSLIIIEVEVPLLRAQQYVTKAQGYLAAKNAGKADKALMSAELRAMALYNGVNSPLTQAHQNIWLAFRNYSTAKGTDVGAYLKQARNYLGKAAAARSEAGKEEIGTLSQEVAKLENTLATEGRIAESALKSALEKSEALAKRTASYYSAGLSEAETTLGGERSLIEARMHVSFAETYQVTTSEPDKAIRELDTAVSYLQKAAGSKLADHADRKKIRSIVSMLQALEANPGKNDATVQERYETIQEELSGIKLQEELSDLSQEVR
jgi:hypothetical protein